MQGVDPEEKTDLEEEPEPQEWSLKRFVYGALGSALLLIVAVGLLMAVFSWIEPGEVGTAIMFNHCLGMGSRPRPARNR